MLAHYVAMVTGDDAAYETAVSDDVPLSYWRLDEAAGPFAADEQAANPGTYQGSPGYVQPGAEVVVLPPVVGSSVGFSGDDSVDVGDVSGLAGDLTYELWLKPENFDVWRNPLAKAYGGEGAITQTSTGKLYFLHGTSGVNGSPYQSFGTSGTLPLGEWTHVVVTRSGDTLTWYLNGMKDVERTQPMTPVESSLPLLIGDGYTSNYVGGIDEVAVYGEALSEERVLAHYVAMVTGDDAAYETAVSDDVPLSYWRLDEAAGPFAADEQAANPGTYQGSPGYVQPGAEAP